MPSVKPKTEVMKQIILVDQLFIVVDKPNPF